MSGHGDPSGAFLTAARGGRPSRRPLWIMRQAGRYLPEYREVRSRFSFLELCNTPAAAAEVTLQPVRRFGLDAAILFTDLLIPLPPMGIGIRYEPGPVLERTIVTRADVDSLVIPDPERDLTPMLDTVRLVRGQLAPEVALIGFVGAPFTMACYLIEGRGSKNWDRTRRLLHEDPATFAFLLTRITDALQPLVTALVAAGCDAVQVFDSWAAVLGSRDWAELCAPQSDRLLTAARDAGAVAIHYVNGAVQHLERMISSPAAVLGIDWRVDMADARARTPAHLALQGNLDPTALFGSESSLRQRVAAICRAAGERHVFNLGHGILPETDPRSLDIVVDEVRKW
ncbi:MAG: uroporphyrinogen decarboxylase [Planctomycetes bacterium]|nr:uroporphyrinogen decarboxylase [Planctomycetota bacterium]